MENVFQTIEKNGLVAKIMYDPEPFSPREWDNLTKMICFHNRYNLGDKHDYDANDYSGWEEMKKDIIKNEKPYVILPLYLYDHSGITISTKPFSCPWDSGQIGFVIVNKEGVDRCMGWKRVTAKRREELERQTIGEVKTYDQYLGGDVYGYKIEDEEGNCVDSCYGFYELDHLKEEVIQIMELELEK